MSTAETPKRRGRPPKVKEATVPTPPPQGEMVVPIPLTELHPFPMLRIQRVQEAVLSETGGIIDGEVELFELMGVTTMTLGASEELFYIQEIPGTNSVNIIPASRNGESVSALRPLFGGSRYAARGAVEITSAGKQQDLARQFVDLLLSQSVQDVYLYDGFPVNSHSLDRLVKDVTGFRGMCDKLDTPILVDQVVKEAVQSQLRGLMDGTSVPEDAASAVMEKTKLYLME